MQPEKHVAIHQELMRKFADLTHHEVGVIISSLGRSRNLLVFVASREEFGCEAWEISAEQWWQLLEDHRKGRTTGLLMDGLTTYVLNMDTD
jgi:hypothetical protein